MLDNSERGVWVLTAKGKDIDSVDPRQVTRFVLDLKKGQRSKSTQKNKGNAMDVEVVEVAEAVLEETWREELLPRLLNLSPAAFER